MSFGASVIVVKGIKVLPALARHEINGLPSSLFSIENGYATNTSTTMTDTKTEGDSLSETDGDESHNYITTTITFKRPKTDEPGNSPVFAMDSEAEASNAPDNLPLVPVQP